MIPLFLGSLRNKLRFLTIQQRQNIGPSIASEITWLTTLLKDFEVDVTSAMVFGDNQYAIHLSTNPSFYKCSKHIEIDCYFIREKVNQGVIRLIHIPSQHQLVDLLTKPVAILESHWQAGNP